jgi:hypothetical protein
MAELMRKIQGSTLIEVIVAMVITMTVLGISFMVILNLKKHNDLNRKFYVYSIVQSEFIKTKRELKYFNEIIEYENIILSRSIHPCDQNKKVNVLLLEAFNKQGVLLLEKKELILLPY